MELSCPGSKANASRETILVPCPSCAREMELFGDEPKARCRCGQWVFREALPSCAQWCPAAQQCLGEVGDLAELLQRAGEVPNFEEQQRRLRELRERIREAQSRCSLPESRQDR
ncbi:MAG TPA: hypothetical protein VM492_08150 [Sumerlaeia bacterium]|nr:hypothetical protein [Sumerlaeia bacterium]